MRMRTTPSSLLRAPTLNPKSDTQRWGFRLSEAALRATSYGEYLASTSFFDPSHSVTSAPPSTSRTKCMHRSFEIDVTRHQGQSISISSPRECPSITSGHPPTHCAKGCKVRWPTYVARPGSFPHFS